MRFHVLGLILSFEHSGAMQRRRKISTRGLSRFYDLWRAGKAQSNAKQQARSQAQQKPTVTRNRKGASVSTDASMVEEFDEAIRRPSS
jgi:hypothetical protein